MPIFCEQPLEAFCPQWAGEDRCWIGVPRYFGVQGADWEGCDIGCWPCDDGSDVGSGVVPGVKPHAINGRRWLRIHWEKPSRAADGSWSPINSATVTGGFFDARALLVPTNTTHFIRAACWTNSGRECFDDKICRCEPGPPEFYGPGDGGRCPDGGDGAGVNEALGGFLPDEFFYKGHKWAPTGGDGGTGSQEDSDIYCRSFQNDDTIYRTVEVENSGFLSLPTVLRTGNQGHNACTVNPFVGCAAKPPNSPCPSSFSDVDGGDHYIDGRITEKFNEIAVRWGEYLDVDENVLRFDEFPRLRQPSPRIQAPTLEAATDIQNRALAHMLTQELPLFNQAGGTMNFQRMQYDAIAGSAQTDNNKLDRWSRSWNAADGGEFTSCALLDQPAPSGSRFLAMPSCYLKNAGCSVTVNAFVAFGKAAMGFMAMHVDLVPASAAGKRLIPYARILVEATIGYRAQLNEPCEGVTIINAGDPGHSVTGDFCELLPEVAGDEIVYVHDGQLLDYPPLLARWRGFLGNAGEHQTVGFFSTSEGGAEGFCCGVKRALRRVEVWGKPSQWGSRPDGVSNLHMGVVTLDFDEPESCA